MSRKVNRIPEEEQDLNLAPIMNMVIILIPLLLLSVVFLKVGVINVTTPTLTPSSTSEANKDTEEPQKITVAIGARGFTVATRDGVVPGCGDVTICVRDDVSDLSGEFETAAKLLSSGAHAKGQAAMDQAMEAYDWPALYSVLARVKDENPGEDTIYVSADARVPYAALVRLFDVARTRLAQDSFDTAAAFYSAKADKTAPELFPNPIVTVVQ